MMSMQTMFDADRAQGFSAVAGFRFGEAEFTGEVGGGRFEVSRGKAERPDFAFECTPEQLGGLLYGGAPLESMKFEGDRRLAERFITLFPLPPKVA